MARLLIDPGGATLHLVGRGTDMGPLEAVLPRAYAHMTVVEFRRRRVRFTQGGVTRLGGSPEGGPPLVVQRRHRARPMT